VAKEFVRTSSSGTSRTRIGIPRPPSSASGQLAHYHGRCGTHPIRPNPSASPITRWGGISTPSRGPSCSGCCALFDEPRQAPGEVAKVYVRDALLTRSLDIEGLGQFSSGTRIGASWKASCSRRSSSASGSIRPVPYFWALISGRSSICSFVDGNRRYGFEIKRTTAPASRRPSVGSRDLSLTGSTSSQPGRKHSPWQDPSAPCRHRGADDMDPLGGRARSAALVGLRQPTINALRATYGRASRRGAPRSPCTRPSNAPISFHLQRSRTRWRPLTPRSRRHDESAARRSDRLNRPRQSIRLHRLHHAELVVGLRTILAWRPRRVLIDRDDLGVVEYVQREGIERVMSPE